MSYVKAKLAAAGWSDKTSNGDPIISFGESNDSGWFGEIEDDNGVRAISWNNRGVDIAPVDEGPQSLVPLPAPELERLTDGDRLTESELAGLRRVYGVGSKVWRLSSELTEARQTIGEFIQNGVDLCTKIDQQAAEIQRLARDLDSERCHNEDEEANQQEKSATIRRQAEIIERLTRERDDIQQIASERYCELMDTIRERDAAIELARSLRFGRLGNEYFEACEKFDARYGDKPAPSAPPPTCEPLPPANEAPQYIECHDYPGLLFRVASYGPQIECDRIIIDPKDNAGPWQGQFGGVWRAI